MTILAAVPPVGKPTAFSVADREAKEISLSLLSRSTALSTGTIRRSSGWIRTSNSSVDVYELIGDGTPS
jgi:hypothetical protein